MRVSGQGASREGGRGGSRLLTSGVAVLVVVLAALVFAGAAVASPSGLDKYSGVSHSSPGTPQAAAAFAAAVGGKVLPVGASALGVSAAATGSISGKVTNSSGTGLANVVVIFWDQSFNVVASVLTTSSGTYSITGLPNETLTLCTANDLNYIDEWYKDVQLAGNWTATGATWLNLASTATRTGINFLLAAGKSISGYVQDGYGNSVQEQEVDVYDLSGNLMLPGTTDATGAYSVKGLPAGQYHERTVNALGYIDEWYNNDPVIADPYAELATAINVSSSNATSKNFALEDGQTIAGTVHYSGGGLPNVEIRVQPLSRNGAALWAQTDAWGNYQISGLLPGEYIANTANDIGYIDEWYDNHVAPGDLDGADANPIDVTSGDQLTIDFTLDFGHNVGGYVTDNAPGGALVDPGVFVEVYDAAGKLYAWTLVGSQNGGSYYTWALPAGTYYVRTDDRYAIGYVDEWYNNKPCGAYNLADADPLDLSSSSAPSVNFGLDRMTRYEQTDGRISYTPAWTPFAAPSASGGSYSYCSAANAAATVYFTGTRLDAVVMEGTTTGSADFWVDGVKTDTIDLSAAVATYNVKVFTTGVLSNEPHKLEIKYTSSNASGKRITLDAVDVAGVLTYAPPAITSLSPSTGFTLGGDSVVITGTNLSGATAVTFGGIPAASVTVNSATQITAVTPVHSAGTVQVQVTTATGSSVDTPTDDFTFAAPGTPTITSLSPSTGSVDGGTSVTINGTNFAGLSGAAAVTFGGANATSYITVSATKITAVAPAHAAGAVRVQVTAAGGSTADTANDDFTYSTTPPMVRYDQTNLNIVKTGTWVNYTSSPSFGGTYGRSATSGATATIWFNGTRLDWIAMEGTTTGMADVYVDGLKVTAIPVNLAASPAVYQQNVWTSGPLSNGLHSVKIVRSASSASGKFLTLDAVEIYGTISAPRMRYEQTNTSIVKVGTWATFSTASASGASYARSLTSAPPYPASATIYFTGSRIDYIAMKGTTAGVADVYLDGVLMTPSHIVLNDTVASYNVMVWSSGTIGGGDHILRIERNTGSGTSRYLTLDAVDIWGTIRTAP